MKICVKNI